MRNWILPAVAICTGLTSIALADPTFEDNGDSTQAPYYRSIAVSGNNNNGQPAGGFGITDGDFYSSNGGPQLNTTVNATTQINGATLQVSGDSTFGGFYLAHNNISLQVSNAQSADGYYGVAGQGTKTTVEFFAPVDAASATYHWHVSGTDTAPIGEATSRLDFFASTDNQDWNTLFNENAPGIHSFGPGDYTTNISTQINTPIYLYYWSSAFAEIDNGVAADGTNATLSADYTDTYSLDSIDLYDTNGDLIPNWTLEDEETGQTVFNQDGRVPEPASVGILVVGSSLLRRRRMK